MLNVPIDDGTGNPSPRTGSSKDPVDGAIKPSPRSASSKDDNNKLRINAGFLGDASNMKDELHEDLGQAEYNVFDFYWETGFWSSLAKNDKFGNLTLGVISLNAVWIGVDSDHNVQPPGKTLLQFVVADQFFCVFFTFEWLTRFLAFQHKRNCLKDGWFKFDSCLVFLMVFETWLTPLLLSGGGGGGMGNTSMLRLLRLLRLTRMARLMRSVPELVTLLKGMAAAVRSVSSVLVLLIIFTYIFAIIFKGQTEGDEELEMLFGSIPEAMWNLLMAGTLLDNITAVLNMLRERNQAMCAVFLVWVLLSSFTMLNMLIGVLCEVVAAVSEAEKEKNAVSFAKAQFLTVLERIDQDGNGTISEAEFKDFVMDEDVKAPLDDLEVDRENLLGLSDVIFSAQEEKDKNPATCVSPDDFSVPTAASRGSLKDARNLEISLDPRELQFGEMIEQILDLRGSNPAMVSHIVDLRKHLRTNQKETIVGLQELSEEVEKIDELREELKDVRNELVARQDSIVNNMLLPMIAGIRQLQEKAGCSNLIRIPSPTQCDPSEWTSAEVAAGPPSSKNSEQAPETQNSSKQNSEQAPVNGSPAPPRIPSPTPICEDVPEGDG